MCDDRDGVMRPMSSRRPGRSRLPAVTAAATALAGVLVAALRTVLGPRSPDR